MADLKTLEALMDKDTFYGEGEISFMEVDMEYSPGKYDFVAMPPVFKNLGTSSTVIKFSAPYKITEISTGMLGALRKLSNIEMRAVESKGTLVQYLWADPRYVLKFSKDVQPLLNDVYYMRIDDAHARKMEKEALANQNLASLTPYVITAEMHFENDAIKKMILRSAMADGSVVDKEEIEFHR